MNKLSVQTKVYQENIYNVEYYRCDIVRSYDGINVFHGSAEGRGSFGYGLEELDVDFSVNVGQVVFVVVVKYSTGDTFGTESGIARVVDIFDDAEKALGLKEKILEFPEASSIEYDGKKYYTGTWVGYYESLDDVHVETEMVKA